MWDYVVFDKELPIKPKDKKKEEQQKNKKGQFQKKPQFEMLNELDQYHRPAHKVCKCHRNISVV